MSSPASSPSLIELELLREQKYKAVYEWLVKKTPRGTKGSILSHMLLRYLFNLSASATDDPVFRATGGAIADRQFKKDVLSFKLGDSKHALFLVEGVASMFKKAAAEIKAAKPAADKAVVKKDGNLFYGPRKFKDVRGLGEQDAQAAFALHVRYTYLYLSNHGLARLYPEGEDATEGFANPFNVTHKSYCSFFPDLETRFGSRGNFFDQQSFPEKIVYINPPYDQSLMASSFNKVYKLLADGATNTFVFTIPDWSDFPEALALENSKWTRRIVEYTKGELEFIDHMTGQKICPCGILEITLSNSELSEGSDAAASAASA